MRLDGLPEALADHGIPPAQQVQVAGWQTRGNDFGPAPIGSTDHWTAGSTRGEAPSLAIVTYGRQTPTPLPGPLYNLLRGRAINDVRRVFIVASGKANHAGQGSWNTGAGVADSNYELVGVSAEYHPNEGPITRADLAFDARIHAAVADLCGFDQRGVHGHWEYAPDRKIDRKPHGPDLRMLVETNLTNSQGDDFDMDKATFQRWMREELNKGTGPGQTNWAGTSAATLAGIQKLYNQTNRILGAIANLDLTVDLEAELTDAQVTELTDVLADLLAAMPDQVATRLIERIGNA